MDPLLGKKKTNLSRDFKKKKSDFNFIASFQIFYRQWKKKKKVSIQKEQLPNAMEVK